MCTALGYLTSLVRQSIPNIPICKPHHTNSPCASTNKSDHRRPSSPMFFLSTAHQRELIGTDMTGAVSTNVCRTDSTEGRRFCQGHSCVLCSVGVLFAAAVLLGRCKPGRLNILIPYIIHTLDSKLDRS